MSRFVQHFSSFTLVKWNDCFVLETIALERWKRIIYIHLWFGSIESFVRKYTSIDSLALYPVLSKQYWLRQLLKYFANVDFNICFCLRKSMWQEYKRPRVLPNEHKYTVVAAVRWQLEFQRHFVGWPIRNRYCRAGWRSMNEFKVVWNILYLIFLVSSQKLNQIYLMRNFNSKAISYALLFKIINRCHISRISLSMVSFSYGRGRCSLVKWNGFVAMINWVGAFAKMLAEGRSFYLFHIISFNFEWFYQFSCDSAELVRKRWCRLFISILLRQLFKC